jgi:hypothetical protein
LIATEDGQRWMGDNAFWDAKLKNAALDKAT